MKSKYLVLAGAYMLLSVFAACTDEASEQTLMSGELKKVTATADEFKPEVESRGFYLDGNSVKFTWADGDTIGIFPTTGAQAYFPILVGSETSNSASFTGGGWALKSSTEYASYYPFIGDFYLDKTQIPVSYVGQKQNGNASLEHLNVYDYMTAVGTPPEGGKVNFQFKHLGAFVQIKITMPQGGTITSVTLSADEAVFTTEGTYDLTAATPTITATQKSKTITLDVENVTTTAESNVATLYLMLAPVDLTGKTLSAIVKKSNGSSETITLTGKNFKAGGAYGVSGTMKDPNGGVTAGDGTYANGVVSVDVAGNMKKLLGSDYLNITELKVVGPINGFDIYYLRKMLGSSHFSSADWGKLTTLDLSEATIVEGDWYYDPSSTSGNEYYSENNVIGDYMFFSCANLQSITLPKNITSIGERAFYGCNVLSAITIPDEVISIGEQAFYYCGALSTITIPDKVTSIGEQAFYYCEALASVYISDISAWCKISFSNAYSNPLYNGAKLYLNNNLVTELTISDDVTEIKDYTFYNCKSITKVTIPDNVTSIGFCAFENCDELMSISVGNGVTSISNYAFRECDALTEATILSGSIGERAFYNCAALASVIIGDGVTSIGYCAFSHCTALVSVVIGDGVTSIGDYAFSSCTSLASVVIGDGVIRIPQYAFLNCDDLASVVIGSGVTVIVNDAFEGCSISECYCYATTPPWVYNESFSTTYPVTLYVPARCGAIYESSDWRLYFTNIIEMD